MYPTTIPAFAAITLLFGGVNEVSLRLTLVGVLATILHAALSPENLSGPYPDFDNYHPRQPPLRDYMLVFGLASLMLAALLSRIHPMFWSLVRATRRRLVSIRTSTPLGGSCEVQGTTPSLDLRPIHRTPQPHSSPSPTSPSHTFIGQWTTTASTLADRSPAPISPRSAETDHSEVAALKARVSQLEAALEEMRRRIDSLTIGQKGTDMASGTMATVVAEQSPSDASPPIPDLNTTVPLPTPSLSPLFSNSNLKPVDAREHLSSLVEFVLEGTRQTDRLILKMRTILAKADATDDEDDSPLIPPTSSSTPIPPTEHLPLPFPAAPFTPSPSPSPSPSTRLEALRTPIIRRVGNYRPLPSAVGQVPKTTETLGTPNFNMALDLLNLSRVPCSTPLRSAKEIEHSISPSHSSSLDILEGLVKPAPKRSEVNARVRPASRITSILTRPTPQDSIPRQTRSPSTRLRELTSNAFSTPPSRLEVGSTLDSRNNTKGKGKAARVSLNGLSNWLAEYRRRNKTSRGLSPLRRNSQARM